MTLPEELHGLILENLNEFLEQTDSPIDFEELASAIVSTLIMGAEEYDVADGEDLIEGIESESSLDAPLTEVLAEELSQNEDYTISGGELLNFISEFLNLDWGEEINGDFQDLSPDGFADPDYGELLGEQDPF